MSVVESAVSFLVEKLRDTLIEEIILLRGVKDQIEWVETEFRRIECFLKDADGHVEDNESMKNWRRELRDITHCAEDAIDIFLLKVDHVRRTTGYWRKLKRAACILNEIKACHGVDSQVKRMKQKLRSISESRTTYNIQFNRSGAGLIFHEQMPSSHHREEEADFVGFKDELNDLVSKLTSSVPRQQPSAFSIVGMDGLGKTTLAKQLYNHPSVKRNFKARAWVSIPQQYSLKAIYRTIYKQVVSKNVADMEKQELEVGIVGFLAREKYLIVLNDVENKKAWDDLVGLFPKEKNGSSWILLTTHDEGVALHADALIKPHPMRSLNEDESWELFCKKAFKGSEALRCDLEKEGKEIAKKCGGFPLAIVAIGSALAGKDKTEWEHASKSIGWQLGEGEAKISHILYSSYKRLPYELKPCFLYLAIFPEDEEIYAKRLIYMWIAEGLLRQRGDETLEEVGEDCLKALARKSMVEVVKRRSNGGIKRCRIHDRLRDLALSEAKGDEFLQVYRPGNNSMPSTSMKARRLAIYDSNATTACISSADASLRSVFTYPREVIKQDGRQRHKFRYSRFKLLRVLDLNKEEIEELPSVIGNLVHLRYLAFTCARVLKSLPRSIGNLRNLQTLICYSVEGIRIPSSIEKMRGLRHVMLKSPNSYKHGESGSSRFEGHPRVGQLSNLQTLTNIRVDKWENDDLGKLKGLRKLGIAVGSGDYSKFITKLESLQSLSISAAGDMRRNAIPKFDPLTDLLKLLKLSLFGRLEKLPEPVEFPANLTKLAFAYSDLQQEDIATLGKLPKLETLKLVKQSYMGKIITFPRFPCLKYLQLKDLQNLEKVRFEGAMRSLVSLNISLCDKLKMPLEGQDDWIAGLKLEIKLSGLLISDVATEEDTEWSD